MSLVLARPATGAGKQSISSVPVVIVLPNIFGIADWAWGKIFTVIGVLILIAVGVVAWLYFAYHANQYKDW